MTSKLELYNMALGHLRERKLTSVAEQREPRRVLDDFWDQVVGECIEEAYWKFMIRTVQADASVSVVPTFGWTYAFTIPDDCVRLKMISGEETFNQPLLDYMEEAGYWYANLTPLYVRYVSNDRAYGLDMSRWTKNFSSWVSFKLAEYSCGRITGSDALLTGSSGSDGIIKRGHKAKVKAKSIDAMEDPPGQIPAGTWVRSRRGYLRGLPAPGGDLYDD